MAFSILCNLIYEQNFALPSQVSFVINHLSSDFIFSESELQSLLDDDSKLEMFVMSLPPVQRLKEEKESIIQSNQHQASKSPLECVVIS